MENPESVVMKMVVMKEEFDLGLRDFPPCVT